MTTYQGGKKRIGKKIHDVIILLEEEIYSNEKLQDNLDIKLEILKSS